MKFIKIILALIGMVLLLASCSLSPKRDDERMSEIYSQALSYEDQYGSMSHIDYCQEGDLVISSLTEDYPFEASDWEWVRNNFAEIETTTWENFLQVSLKQSPVPSDLDLNCDYTLLDIKQNPPNLSWENCQRIHYFSQIGFNPRKDQALVYRGTSCGDYAYGNLYFAERIDGRWIITDMAGVFVT